MPPDELDRVDLAILHVLQADARNLTTETIGDRVGLSASSVSVRINALESRGIVTGYAPVIDYDAAGFGSHVLVRATVPSNDREAVVEAAVDHRNVVSVTRLLGDHANLLVEFVGFTQSDVEEAIDELSDHAIEVLDTTPVGETYGRVFDTFGEQFVLDDGERS